MVGVTAERNLFGQLLILSHENEVDLEKIMSCPLGPVLWALATPDGLPVKTDKSSLMHKLEDPSALHTSGKQKEDIEVIDGNCMFYILANLPSTFGELAMKIFLALPKANLVHFVTDTYRHNSIKCFERERRGDSHSYMVRGSSTRLPKDCKLFLSNNENKTQLINFLLCEWQQDIYGNLLLNREIFFTCEFSISSCDGITTDSRPIHELISNQEEADTLIILHSLYADTNADTDKKKYS